MTNGKKILSMLISIHTTLAGGDPFTYDYTVTDSISIHTTLAGGDWRQKSIQSAIAISIHTTLAGGDQPMPLLPLLE